jgi:hypothetical protein
MMCAAGIGHVSGPPQGGQLTTVQICVPRWRQFGAASLVGARAIKGMAMLSTGRRFWTLSGRGIKTIIAIAVLMSMTPALADNIYLTESGTCATGYVRNGRFCVAIETGYEVRSCPRSTFRSGDFCKVKPDPAYHLLDQWFSDLGFRSR